MLSEKVCSIAGTAASLTLCLLSFRWGVRFGTDPQTAAEQKVLPNLPRKKRREDPEMEKTRAILENIENYSGDGSRQRKIEW